MSSESSSARMLLSLLLHDSDFPFGVGGLPNFAPIEQQDSYLQALHRLLISLCRQRNTSLPFSSLPPEILCRIFAFAKNDWDWPRVVEGRIDKRVGGTRSDDNARTREGWFSLTYVCARWRQIIVNDPTFWADPINICTIPLRLVPLIIERSQSLPFRLDLRFRGSLGVPPLLANLGAHASVFSRVREFRLHNFPVELYRHIECHLQTVFLYLDHLSVSLLQVDSHPVILPEAMCLSPSVSQITLVDCVPTGWSCPLFSAHLTHLELRFPESTSPDFLPTTMEFANILSIATSLEVLELEEIFPTFSPMPTFDYPPMILPPSMQYLRVSAMEDSELHCECLRFLAHLVISHGIHIDVHIRQSLEEGSFSDEYQRMMSTLAATAIGHIYDQQPPPAELIVGKRTLFTHDSPCLFPEWPVSMDTHCFHNVHGATSLLSFEFEVQTPLQHFHQGVLPVRLDGLRAISFMQLSPGDEPVAILDGEAWWHMLGDANLIRRLGIHVEDCATLLPLSECMLIDGLATFPILPGLTTIHIHADASMNRDSDLYFVLEQDLNSLLVLAKSRMANGAPQLEFFVDENLREWPIWDMIRAETGKEVQFSSFPVPSAYADGTPAELLHGIQ